LKTGNLSADADVEVVSVETNEIPRPPGAGDLSSNMRHRPEVGGFVETVLWVIAVILVITGIVFLIRRQFLWGAGLIVLGLLVGPGGVSIFT
jgi:hypothetical protein